MTRKYTHHNAAACEIVQAAGIAPETVALSGLGADGYYAFLLDEDGRKILDPYSNGPLLEWRTWPSPEVGKAVVDAVVRRA